MKRISKAFCAVVLYLLVSEVQGFYPFAGELRKKFDRHVGLVFDAPTVWRKMYVEEVKKSIDSEPQFNPELSKTLSRNILQMAHSIGSIAMQEMTQNFVVFSPLSIATALALLLLGSDGRTNDELMQLFGFDKNSIFRQNRKEIHDQFGFLIEDLLRSTPHPRRVRPVDTWKYKTLDTGERRFSNYFGNQHKIEIANGIFVQNGLPLKAEYQASAERVYRGEIKTVDFKENGEMTRKLINDWAEKKTNGRIHEILAGGIPTQTNMILASALYFKALWENTFIEEVTSKRPFYPEGKSNNPVLVDMMITGGEFPYYDAEDYGCRIIGLPYKGNQTTMYVILPYNSNKQKLFELQQFLTAERFDEIISKLKMTSAFVMLPKMRLEGSLNLKDILQSLGVHSLFSSTESDLSLIADGFGQEKPVAISRLPSNHKDHDEPFIFNRFGDDDDFAESEQDQRENYEVLYDSILRKRATTGRQHGNGKKKRRDINASKNSRRGADFNPRIFVDDVLHKADLTINEKGTEGGAATLTFFGRSDIDLDFRVESPFLFLIRHDATKLPLFYGSVNNPVT